MSYADFLDGHMDGLSWGAPDNSASFLDVAAAALPSAYADTSFFRDMSNSTQFDDRNKALREAGINTLDDAISRNKMDIGLFGESGKAYAERVGDESNFLADEAIMQYRMNEPDSPVAQQRTTSEIREMTVAARQAANRDFADVASRAESGFARIGGALAGSALGVMMDPINALTLPLGASASTGILRGMLIDGAINVGVEALQTPENMVWAKEAGVDYGFGEAAMNIATAGVGGAALSGILRGTGKLLTRGKSVEVLDRIAADKTIPTEARDAAHYQARVAQIDEGSPIAGRMATDEEIAINRQNLQETADAIANNREAIIDESIFNKPYQETDEFKVRFEGSKAVADDGKPLLAYHATKEDFTEFDVTGGFSPGSWFSLDRTSIAPIGDRVLVSYLAIKSPAKLTDLAVARMEVAKTVDMESVTKQKFNSAVINNMKAKGFDGIIDMNANGVGGKKIAVAFDRGQIIPAFGGGMPQRSGKGGAGKAKSGDTIIDDIAPNRMVSPTQAIEERVAEVTNPGVNEALMADFQRLVADRPDMEIGTMDGAKTLRDIAEDLKQDEAVLQAITFCGVGK